MNKAQKKVWFTAHP